MPLPANVQKYLLIFAQTHSEFRIPELESVSKMYDFKLWFPPFTGGDDDGLPCGSERPFMIVGLEDEQHARLLAARCVLMKSVYHFYAHSSSYSLLHPLVLSVRPTWQQYTPDTPENTFRFVVDAFNRTVPLSRQREIVECFSYMKFLGKIDLRKDEDVAYPYKARVVLGIFEEYDDRRGTRNGGDEVLKGIYFGRLIVKGTARSLIHHFNVKQRSYFGNTSMDAEVSLLMANQTMAKKGMLIWDPFVGTGGLGYPVAHFGALFWGSDIDGRQMRGKGNVPGIYKAATQYSIRQQILDLVTFDVTNAPWVMERCAGMFDSIITDPPYGVRAGAKRLGRKIDKLSDEERQERKRVHTQHRKGDSDFSPYIPPTRPYELSHLAADLILLSRFYLKPGGRLVFFLPTVNEEYQEVDVRSMLCEGMEVVSNSLQDFGPWGRRLITIEKSMTDQNYPPPVFSQRSNDVPHGSDAQDTNGSVHVPAHKDFREKYFAGFGKERV